MSGAGRWAGRVDVEDGAVINPFVRRLTIDGKARRHPFCKQSREQDRNARALVVIASTNPQFTADPVDKRPNNPHSQSFAGGWIKFKTGPSLQTDSA